MSSQDSYLRILRKAVLNTVFDRGRAYFGEGYGPICETAYMLHREGLLKYSDFGPQWYELTDKGKEELGSLK